MLADLVEIGDEQMKRSMHRVFILIGQSDGQLTGHIGHVSMQALILSVFSV